MKNIGRLFIFISIEERKVIPQIMPSAANLQVFFDRCSYFKAASLEIAFIIVHGFSNEL